MPWLDSLDAGSRLEARLRESGPADRATRALMAELLLANVDAFAALLDPHGTVLDVTSAALRHGGLDRDDVVGHPLWRTPIWLSPGDAAAARDAVERAATGRHVDVAVGMTWMGSSPGFRSSLAVRPVRANAGHIAFLVAHAPSDPAGATSRQVGADDEDTLLSLQISRLFELRQRLVADVSHDAKVPLQSIIARAERLLQLPDPAVRQDARELRAAALSALEQLAQLADLASLEHRRTRPQQADCDVVTTVLGVIRQFEPVAAVGQRSLVVHAPPALVARIDEDKLSRIVANLVGNAIRYARRGGHVRCGVGIEEGWVVIEVADDGRGIDLEHRAAVFTRSWRSPDERRHTTGSGLGLAIVREAVRVQGGTIEIGDAPEGGALMIVRLPYLPPDGHARELTLNGEAARALATQVVVADVERRIDRAPDLGAELYRGRFRRGA
jgi:signal transduction histidine kinase